MKIGRQKTNHQTNHIIEENKQNNNLLGKVTDPIKISKNERIKSIQKTAISKENYNGISIKLKAIQ